MRIYLPNSFGGKKAKKWIKNKEMDLIYFIMNFTIHFSYPFMFDLETAHRRKKLIEMLLFGFYYISMKNGIALSERGKRQRAKYYLSKAGCV